MPRAPRGSGSTRRPSPESGTPREISRSRPTARAARSTATETSRDTGGLRNAAPESDARGPSNPTVEKQVDASRFQIFVIDAGWHSPARKVLHENFAFLSDLQQGDPIYVLGRQKSLAVLRSHPSLMGKGPVIVVHDLSALRESGTGGFHGFRLHLGLMRSEQQALLALQTFARFLVTHRRSVDLEAEIRRDLRREGILGAIEIILHHEPREIGG